MKSFSRYRRCINIGLTGLALWPVMSIKAQVAEQNAINPLRILVVGDSLSAEYGLKRGSGWVDLLKQSISTSHPQVEIINASISGDTTSGGLSRLKALLDRTAPHIVLIELGANDALRGLPLDMTRNNLVSMIKLVKDANAKPALAGMQIPPNYGREYTEAFRELFQTVARSEGAELIPFLLEGIADDPSMFQADTIHPNEQAQPVLMENVKKIILPMINQARKP